MAQTFKGVFTLGHSRISGRTGCQEGLRGGSNATDQTREYTFLHPHEVTNIPRAGAKIHLSLRTVSIQLLRIPTLVYQYSPKSQASRQDRSGQSQQHTRLTMSPLAPLKNLTPTSAAGLAPPATVDGICKSKIICSDALCDQLSIWGRI